MLALYLDEDIQHRGLVAALRGKGFDCLTANEAGRRGYGDESHLEYATAVGRVLFTRNTGDFAELHQRWISSGRRHSGIIALTEDRLGIGLLVGLLTTVAAERKQGGLAGEFIYLLNSYR